LPLIRSSRFDAPLTYACGDLDLHLGDVVRVPLGEREVFAFVTSDPYDAASERPLRSVIERTAAPPAFNATGLALARFIAAYYICTLGEALSAIVLNAAVPRVLDRLTRAPNPPHGTRYPSVPRRLLRLIWEELPSEFSLSALLRHPEARRSGDRGALLRAVGTLARGGDLLRERVFADPRTREHRIKTLYPALAPIRGPKARALVDFVRAHPGVPRADALLAGFSNAVIARTVAAGALSERHTTRQRKRLAAPDAPERFTLTPEQASALLDITRRLRTGAFSQVLLHGITGSGKTFVYIQAIREVVRSAGRAIVLVPEISLTPQTARRFEEAFGQRVAVLHSALSERDRYDAWQACAQGDVDVVVGARSAVFAPLEDVRLLIVDEAHETSYKQESVPRYDALTVARKRMQLEGGVLVLGSATPSVESYFAARSGKIAYLCLHSRATLQPLPAVRVVDMAAEFESGNRHIFSSALTQALAERLERNEKCVLFVNRRGSARFVLCRACGYVPQCRRCSVALTVHRSEGLMRCHYCDAQEPLLTECSVCRSPSTREFGIGTQRVAAEVERLFANACTIRMDSDTTTRVGDHARLLQEFERRGDVLVGTQMVAKGLDFPEVTLAGVVAADLGLHGTDFRGAEQTFGLITQVCGRSGRARPGEAIVQTYRPDHPAVRFACAHDYVGFAEAELAERGQAAWPPFARLIYLGVIGRAQDAVMARAEQYAAELRSARIGEILGPAPYPIARLNNEWRYRIAIKTKTPAAVRTALRELILPAARRERATRLAIDVDP